MNGIIIQQEVVYKTDRGTPVTDSLKVAEVFGKRHDNVLKSIRNICRPQNVGEQTEQSKWFYESSYIDANGAKRPMFVMNRDGFSLLAMGLTGAKAMQFKVGFIEQFNAMETGLFEIKKTTIQKPDGCTIVSNTTKVTGKGQIYFVNKFLHNNQKGIKQ